MNLLLNHERLVKHFLILLSTIVAIKCPFDQIAYIPQHHLDVLLLLMFTLRDRRVKNPK